MPWLERLHQHLFSSAPKLKNSSSLPSLPSMGIPVFTPAGPDPITVNMALSKLFSVGAGKGMRRVLEREQKVLLTDNAIALVVQMALEYRRTDPTQAAFMLLIAELLDRACRTGIKKAWKFFLQTFVDNAADQQLTTTQLQWLLLMMDRRAQRRFLEEHLELLSYKGLALFLGRLTSLLQDSGSLGSSLVAANILWELLFDARRRGGNVQAVREAYVNQFGGFALDIPDWLSTCFERDQALGERGRRYQTARERIALWQEAIKCGQREFASDMPEILAEMYVRLQQAYNDVRGLDKPQLQQQELAHLLFALSIYTEVRYPIAWALNQNALGSLYHEYLQGDQTSNIEKAIACFQAALRVFTEQDTPREWAQTQNYLGLAYRSRLLGNREENQEKSIQCYKAALRVFTEQDTPRDQAMLLTNMGSLYLERLHDHYMQNQARAINCFYQALRVFNEQEFPVEWATTQNNLGNVLCMYFHGDIFENRQKALQCYQKALKVRTERQFPVEWATTQNNLGNLLSLMEENPEENSEKAIACFQESLRVFTEQDFPVEWARSQNNLGGVYSRRKRGNAQENSEKAIDCFQAALRIYTRQIFPELHMSASLNLAACALDSEMWELAHTTAANAQKAEDDLLALTAGVKEMDTILSQGGGGVLLDAVALVRLGRFDEAAETVERGRARSLANARLLSAADPQRINDPQRRESYILHRSMLQQARAAVHQLAISKQATSSREWLARVAAVNEAKKAFDATVEAIRAARDPADFLLEDFRAETLLQLLSEKPAGHAIIYVLPTQYGGLALGVLGKNPETGTSARFAILNLPELTDAMVRKLMVTTTPDDTSRFIGGYALAQQERGLKALRQSWEGESLAESANRLHAFCQYEHLTSTLDRAAQEIKRSRALRYMAEKPWQELSKDQRLRLRHGFNLYFLCHELRQSLNWLAKAALRPLADWLQQEHVSSVTLIPCDLLAALPLLAAPLEERDGQIITLADRFVASVAPSARSLAQRVHNPQQRHGVAALGNPYPTTRPLAWGEAEALTLAHLGGDPARAFIQHDADRAHLLEILHTAKVVDVSCHATAEYEYLRSRLLLANGEHLTLADALNETLTNIHGLRLLILSACQTAIPDIFGAPDEVRSLAVGMLQAGAQAVLGALWSVSDRATYLLMVRFAQEWFPDMEIVPPTTALARAQSWLRTVTNRELETWQATKPLADNLTRALNSAETKEADSKTDIGGLPFDQNVLQFEASEQDSIERLRSSRYSLQDAEGNLQELAVRGDPDTRPFADPIYWAGFQLYGW
ncbi:CHAT domain-containing protein [Ktedonosporobacter rubrisoli]|uniref:CHAT domain-containing protein n=1 Tax=Ktedonosporobacter rubrisoli TaxID=2509675 RepID=A0A4P6JIF5_KTERU|nr:CHAT domain-containing tetratricopeptide repeat protein [Ktedonosporobacter rubrisoli]QBD74845.1 CHAT domain-containing protein [Ktedonosporobacter rubrisoli]